MNENYFKSSDFYYTVFLGEYWIASRYVNMNIGVNFGIFQCSNGYYLWGNNNLFGSMAHTMGYPLRPVVTLKAGTRLTLGDGQSYQIIG